MSHDSSLAFVYFHPGIHKKMTKPLALSSNLSSPLVALSPEIPKSKDWFYFVLIFIFGQNTWVLGEWINQPLTAVIACSGGIRVVTQRKFFLWKDGCVNAEVRRFSELWWNMVSGQRAKPTTQEETKGEWSEGSLGAHPPAWLQAWSPNHASPFSVSVTYKMKPNTQYLKGLLCICEYI